jgi:hypothetical protein
MWYGNHKTTSTIGAAELSYRAQPFILQLLSAFSPPAVIAGTVLAP